MINHKRLKLTQIAFSLSIALATVPAMAQNTTSSIAGRISAGDGKPAAGATVTIVHTESGTSTKVVTDAEGRYLQRGLRTGGPYTIIISKDGVEEKRDNVYTQLAETATVDATLGAQMQVVTVAGSAARSEKFSKTNMGAGTSISATELAIQGSINRNLQDYARSDPRVSQTDKDRGEMSVAGQNSRYNSLTIDGVAVNDTFGLEASGSPTSKQPISIEAIQSVQVNVANYDVTQKGYIGGNINAVTKSGTNTVKGSVYYVFRDDKLAGDRYNQTTGEYFAPPASKDTTKGVTLGGPIIKDKLFFFANYEKLESSRTTPAFGPIGSSLTNVAISPAAISQAQTIAQGYGIDIGGNEVPTGTKLDVTDKLLKLDWNINDDHRLMVRYSKTEQSEPVFPNITSSALSLNSQWYATEKNIETKVAQLTSDWTPTFSTEFKASQRDYQSVPANNSTLPAVSLSFNGALPAGLTNVPASRSLNFGTEPSRQFNNLNTKTLDLYGGANWTVGDHEIKFGGDYAKNEIFNAFLQNTYGNYSFGCQNANVPAASTAYPDPTKNPAYITYQFNNSAANFNCGTATAAQVEQAVLENFRRGRPTTYTLLTASAGNTLEQNAAANFTMKNTGLFLQDVWTVNPQLTLSYGLRVDRASIPERPTQNATVAQAVGPVNAAGRQTGGFGIDNTVTFDGQTLWQPRAGFNFKFDTPRQTQLRGGAGLFQGAAATVWLANPFQNNGVATRTLSCGSSTSPCSTADGGFNPAVGVAPGTLAASTPVPPIDALAPGLRQPSVWKANIALDHELPWYGIVLGAELLRTQVRDAIYYQNYNLGAATRTGTDGRSLYYTAAGYNGACWNASGTAITSGTCSTFRNKAGSNASFGNVLVATGTNKGYSNVATVSLSRPMSSGYSWSLAYSYTEAKEVSPLTSSTSNSTFSGRSVFNPNEEVSANSSYLVKDRISAVLNFQKRFFDNYKTTFGLFYEGRSGKPYSWTINNDLNGDSISGNDLMYIPSAPGSGQVVFVGDTPTNNANETKFWNIVNSNKALKQAAGGVVGRNTDFSPWTNSFDMRIAQEIPSFFSGHKAVFTFDIFNVGNLLNKKWGRINEVLFQGGGAQARSFVDYAGLDAQGRYRYQVRENVENLEVRQAKGESQWAVQATVKYEF
ncbi:Oar protein [Duganella sp. FT27W]|nr:Oar protein [Duganella sp. FT27W]